MPLFVGAAAVVLVFGFVVVRRIRMDRTNWLIVAVGCLLIALVVLYWSALVQTAHRWFHLSSSLSPQALSLSSEAPVASPSSSVLGPPSLSASFIERVLSAYHSPAVGLGQVLYQGSLASGVDDAYALAFFLHESRMGTTGVAVVTHSLGNIRCTAEWPSCYEGYRRYPTWQAGARDWYRVMASVYLPAHLTTIETIVPVYAPASENDVGAYIVAVKAAVAAWRAGRVLV